MISFVPSSVRSYLRLDAPPDVGRLLESYDVAHYLSTFTSATEVFGLLSVSDVRRALIRGPERVDLLIRLLVAHLEALRDDDKFCVRPLTGSGKHRSGALGWMSGGANAAGQGVEMGAKERERDRHRECLNCLRILTRIIPVVLEGDHDATCDASAEGDASDASSSGGESTSHAQTNPSRASLNSDTFQKQLFLSTLRTDQLPPVGEILTPRAEQTSSLGASSAQSSANEDQFVIDDEEEDDDAAPKSQRQHNEQDPLSAHAAKVSASKQHDIKSSKEALDDEEGGHTDPPLIERLLSVVVDLLFYSGFTIPWTPEQLSLPPNTSARESRVHYAIWEKGVGSSVELAGSTRSHESARVELMRLLLVLLSRSIYVSAPDQADLSDHALHYVACKLDRNVVLPLLCSLLNTGVGHAADSGWLGLGSLAALPSGLVKDRLGSPASGQESRASLVGLCLQTLNVLVGYQPTLKEPLRSTPATTPAEDRPSLAAHRSSSSIASTSSDAAKASLSLSHQANTFRFYLSKLHRHSDFVLLSAGLFEVLSAKVSSNSMGILPLASAAAPALTTGSSGESGAGAHTAEALLLLWRLITLNSRFRLFILDDPVRAPLLLSRLLFHSLTNKDSAAQQGLVRLCVFVLQDISSTPAFAAHVSAPGSANRARIPAGHKWGITAGGSNAGGGAGGDGAGSAADVLIQATYSLMATTKGSLSTLYAPLVISLANTAPAWTNITVLSSQRLIGLLSSFSAPGFLLADESHPRLVFFLLETINAVIHHHPTQNANLIYAILQKHDSVYGLATFTLRKGIAEVRRSRTRSGLIVGTGAGPREFGNIVPRTGEMPTPGSTTPAPLQSPGTAFLSPRPLGADAKDPLAAAAVAATTTAPSNPPAGDEEKARMVQLEEEESVRLAQLTLNEDREAPSEKARGKMRERESSARTEDVRSGNGAQALQPSASSEEAKDEADRWAESLTESELQMAAEKLGRAGFVPTQAWVSSWQKGLPLDSLQILLGEVLPKLRDFVESDRVRGKSDADSRVCAWIRELDLPGVLPASPPVCEYMRTSSEPAGPCASASSPHRLSTLPP